MKRAKAIICAVIFLALAVIKLASPSLSGRISDAISDAMRLETRQTEAAMEFGKSLTEPGAVKAFIEKAVP